MSGTKISAAADITSLNSTDMLPVARSGSTTAYHATMAEVSTYANTNLPTATTAVLGAVKVDGSTVTISGGTISTAPSATGIPAMDGTGSAGSATAWSRGDHVHPSDTTRAPLASPTFTGSPAAPTPTTGDNSTKLATTAFVQSQLVASGAGVSTFNTRAGAVVLQQSDLAALGEYNDTGRNAIHNPGFTVQQRGTGPWTTFGAYTLDRWKTNGSTDTISWIQAPISDAERAVIGDESARTCIQNTFTGNAAAGAYNELYQPIERVSRLSGKTVTISFYAVAGASLRLGFNVGQFVGTGGSPSGGASALAIGAQVTVGTTWARYVLPPIVMPSLAGATLGTNGDDYTQLRIAFSSGANANQYFGNIGVQSGTVKIWGVQLEIGSMATPLARRDPADELALCQRFYYQVSSAGTGIDGQFTGAGNASVQVPFPVTMRAVPTIVLQQSGSANVTGANAYPNQNAFKLLVNVTGSGGFYWNGGATASADL